MQTVSVTEFRGNIKKYLELAEKEKLVIHRNKGVSLLTPLKDEDEDTLLNDAQKKAIDKGLESVAQGNVMSDAEARKKINEKFPDFFK